MALTVGEIEGVIGVDDSKVDSGLNRAEGKFKRFAKTAAVIGAAAGAALGIALAGAMDIEAGNDKLAAQLGLTVAESERIGAVAGSLYANAYGGSMEEVNTAVGAVISSIKGMRSATSSDVEAMTAKVLDFATAFEVDVARASQVAGQMITSGIAKDGVHAMDLLFASMQKVPTAVREDLLDAIDEYGPFMEAVGIKGEQAMGLLVKASEKGMFGIDKTGDAIKEFGIRATDMSKASAAGYEALGMSQEEMTGKLLAGGDTAKTAFNTIITGLQGIKDPTEQSTAALALFGTPLEDLSVSEIPKFLGSLSSAETALGDVAGASERAGQTLNDNATTNLTSFGRQAKQAFVTIVGGMVLPIVTNVARFLATMFGPALQAVGAVLTGTVIPAVQRFGQFIADNQVPITIIGALIAAVFIPHLIALGVQSTIAAARSVAAWVAMKAQAIAGAAAHSIAILGMIGKWLLLGAQAVLHAGIVAGAWLLSTGAAAATALATMVATSAAFVAKWVLMGAQALIQAARMAAAWLIAMGPVGWVIAAVIGLVALIVANWDTIVRVTTAAWNAVWKWVSDRVTAIVNWVRSGIQKVVDFFGWLGSLPGKVAAWFGEVRASAIAKLGELVAWVRGLPGRILEAVGNLGSLLFNKGKEIIQGLIDGIKNMIGSVGSAISSVAGTIADFLPGSPVKKGPLRVLNNGYAGGQISKMLAAGIDMGIPNVVRAAQRVAATVKSPMQRAAAEILKHVKGGGKLFEDFSFYGNSQNVRGLNDQISNRFSSTGQDFTRGNVEKFLKGITVERLEVKAFSDQFRLSQVQNELAMNGVA
ncbi:phage tail tape measure protein [Amycolatopsis palatopharyngis]|uniref:phage tail tape measure protein n=1 Tax=Amycolatopsis palatopharyngis TaxID=187982 RepID=UPI000E23E02A|nr:phage tail tape measure protein [Amycolatopsis palatopharyngis]